MKTKLFNALKPMIADKGLSKEEIEGLAENFAKNLTETSTDDDINNLAKSVVPIAELMQKSTSRQVTATKDKFKDFKSPEQITELLKGYKPVEEDKPQGLTMEQVQQLIAESIATKTKDLTDKLSAYEAREAAAQLQSQLFAHAKVKDIPEFFRKNYTLDKAENLDILAAQIETDYATLKQNLMQQEGLVEQPKGGGIGETDDLIERMHKMAEDASATK